MKVCMNGREFERLFDYVTCVCMTVSSLFFTLCALTASLTVILHPLLSTYSLFLYSTPLPSLMSILMLPYSA